VSFPRTGLKAGRSMNAVSVMADATVHMDESNNVQLVATYACPLYRVVLARGSNAFWCGGCGRSYPIRNAHP